MRVIVWLVRGLVFLALFAFAVNNRHEAYVRWFFGHEWRAPMVFIVLAAFAIGCGFGVFAMVPSWWKHRRVATRRREPATGSVEPSPLTPIAAEPAIEHPRAMDFDFQWLLFALPAAFALGWLASRFDVRQWKSEQRESPKAYTKGLSLLLNEQQDKAIDAFIEAVQQDPDTTDLHFALGNLFRRRGEYERAVRVHEHLLGRGDLPRAERDRAQHALAQDFLKAGLLDRAEEAYRELEGTAYDTEARLALLSLFERSRDWRAAIDTAHKLERSGTGSFSSRISHYWCEVAIEAETRHRDSDVDDALKRARESAPQAVRPIVLTGRRLARQGRHADVVELWGELLVSQPASFNLIAQEFAASAIAAGDEAAAVLRLQAAYRRSPTIELLHAINVLDPDPARQRERLLGHLVTLPTLSAAQSLLQQHAHSGSVIAPAEVESLSNAVGRAAKPLQRYRCAACGFEAQHYFWQCPGCLNWDTYPPQHVEDL